MAKIGPFGELEEAAAGGVLFLEQLGAGDVARHQVGRELHAREREVERLRHGLHEQRLGEAGHADEQHVAAGEERGDEIVDGLLLADDAAADLGDERRPRRCQLLEELDIAGRRAFFFSLEKKRGGAGGLGGGFFFPPLPLFQE